MSFNSLTQTYSTFDLWLTGLLSTGLVLLTALFHYEALRLFTRFLELPGRLPRIRILYLVFGLFVLHTLEIMIFASAYQGLLACCELVPVSASQCQIWLYSHSIINKPFL